MYPVKPKYGAKRPLITKAFGVPGDWLAGHHTGTDFGWTRKRERIRATWQGVIVRVGRGDYYYGNYVVIRHPDGSESWYCHLASIRPSIRVGKRIHTGRWLGYMGQTGNATGKHLHYEERTAPFGYMDHRAPQLLGKRRPWALKGWV